MNSVILIIILACALIGNAMSPVLIIAIGPFPSTLKACWRFQITSLVQLLPTGYNWTRDKDACMMLLRQYIYLPILAGMLLSLSLSSYVLSLQLTSVAHASLLVNTSPLIIVIGSVICCIKVRHSDVIGVFIGIMGLFIISLDLKVGTSSWYGDAIAMFASLTRCLQLLIGQYSLKQKNLPFWMYMLILNISACICCFVMSVAVYRDKEFLGWTAISIMPYVILLGFTQGILANASFNYLMKYLRPIVVTSVMNFGPFLSILAAWAVGYQPVPDPLIWLGGIILTCGNMIVSFSQEERAIQTLESIFEHSISNYEEKKTLLFTIKELDEEQHDLSF